MKFIEIPNVHPSSLIEVVFPVHLDHFFGVQFRIKIAQLLVVALVVSEVMIHHNAMAFRGFRSPIFQSVARPLLNSATFHGYRSFTLNRFAHSGESAPAKFPDPFQDTIYAISSGSVTKSGVSVIRTSGILISV
jgi:hypothetical protein